jgi:hypothetical protein
MEHFQLKRAADVKEALDMAMAQTSAASSSSTINTLPGRRHDTARLDEARR